MKKQISLKLLWENISEFKFSKSNNRQEYITKITLLIIGSTTFVFTIISSLLSITIYLTPMITIINALVSALMFFCLFLTNKGRWKSVRYVPIIIIFLTTTYLTFINGITLSILAEYFFLLLLTSLLLNTQAQLITFLIITATLVAMGVYKESLFNINHSIGIIFHILNMGLLLIVTKLLSLDSRKKTSETPSKIINMPSLSEDVNFANLRENSPFPSFIINKKHEVTYWNKACENITKISAKKIIGTKNHQLAFYKKRQPTVADLIVDQAPTEVFKKHYPKQIEGPQDDALRIEEYLSKTGKRGRWFLSITSPITDESGKIIGAVQTFNDITESKKQAEKINLVNAQLTKQQKAILNILEDVKEEKYTANRERDKIKAVLYSIGDGVYVIDGEGKIILFNQGAETISGFKANEILNKKHDSILKFTTEYPSQESCNLLKNIQETKEKCLQGDHVQLTKKDKTKIAVAYNVTPLKDKGGKTTGSVIAFRDITKQREINRAKTEFISLASHQLRTPLSSMNWFTEILINGDVGKLTKEQLEMVENLRLSNKTMVDLVNSLLSISRIEAGKILITPKLSDVKSIIQNILQTLDKQIKEKQLKVTFRVPKKIPSITIDVKLIRHAFVNIIDNAIRYTPKKGKISISITKKEKYLTIKFTDSGYGIPKNEQNKIFNRFYRGTNVIKQYTGGTGLGLYLAKTVIESSGGKIHFSSRLNHGTTVYIDLPLKKIKITKKTPKLVVKPPELLGK